MANRRATSVELTPRSLRAKIAEADGPLPGPRMHLPRGVLALVVRRFEHRLAIRQFPGRGVGMRRVAAVAVERPQLIGEGAEERQQRLVGGDSISPHAADRGDHTLRNTENCGNARCRPKKTRQARNWRTSRITPPPAVRLQNYRPRSDVARLFGNVLFILS
jgi:hypothetical protein